MGKYRNAWSDSFACNRIAYELAPEDEAARWNLAIAATALRDWEVAEVVWARRIDPVRARIENIPYPESGFRRGDIVLHDGAAVGYRLRGERQCPVFNVLELFEASPLGTFQLLMDAPSESIVEALIIAAATVQEIDAVLAGWTAAAAGSWELTCALPAR